MTFVTRLDEAGATVKELQHLARHATPSLTLNTYAKVRAERLGEVVERMHNGGPKARKCAPSVHALAAGAEG